MTFGLSETPTTLTSTIEEIRHRFAESLSNPWLLVETDSQRLHVMTDDVDTGQYKVSTSKYGIGCQENSFKTPTGAHVIAQRIGGDVNERTVFVGRESTGELGEIVQQAQATESDLILSRILWLKGLEENKNLGTGLDSYHRYIYIHGTHEEGLLGTPASHGCIRMSNKDVIKLYDQVSEGTFVYIV